jgi:hypothetical protein
MNLAKSLLAVLGSYVLSIVLVILTDPLLHALAPDQYQRGKPIPTALLLVSTALFALIAVLCAWICARLAPGKVKAHVLSFFALGEVMGLGTTAMNWGKVPGWYLISWLIVWIPAVFIGWRLARRPLADQ